MWSGDEREPDVHLTILDRLATPSAPAPPAPARAGAVGAVRRVVGLARVAGDAARARMPGVAVRAAATGAAHGVRARLARAHERARAALAGCRRSRPLLLPAVHSVRRPSSRAASTRRLVRRALVPALYALGGVALAVSLTLAWREVSRARSRVVQTHVAPPRAVDRLAHASAALRDPAVTEDAKLAIVDDVARDPREGAIDVLLSAGGSESLLVGMASIRALRGRPCERIAEPLARRLGHGDWRQRAWAAKVLGESACVAARSDLRSRLARERDGRVRRQIATALGALGAG